MLLSGSPSRYRQSTGCIDLTQDEDETSMTSRTGSPAIIDLTTETPQRRRNEVIEINVEQPFSIAMSPSGRRSPIVTRSSSRVVADPGSTSAGSSRAYPIDSRQATHSSDDGFRIRYEVVESLPFVSTPPEDIRNILGFSSLLKKRRRSTTEESSPLLAGCPVCLESLAELKSAGHRLMSTICGHVYCQPCLDQLMMDQNPNCPKCRKKLTKRNAHPIYL